MSRVYWAVTASGIQSSPTIFPNIPFLSVVCDITLSLYSVIETAKCQSDQINTKFVYFKNKARLHSMMAVVVSICNFSCCHDYIWLRYRFIFSWTTIIYLFLKSFIIISRGKLKCTNHRHISGFFVSKKHIDVFVSELSSVSKY